MNPTISLSERQERALAVLASAADLDGNCLFFRTVARLSGLGEREARVAVRALARKGLARYERGLFDFDSAGLVGSGYCATPAGVQRAKPDLVEAIDWGDL